MNFEGTFKAERSLGRIRCAALFRACRGYQDSWACYILSQCACFRLLVNRKYSCNAAFILLFYCRLARGGRRQLANKLPKKAAATSIVPGKAISALREQTVRPSLVRSELLGLPAGEGS